jgi:hypothetical protein
MAWRFAVPGYVFGDWSGESATRENGVRPDNVSVRIRCVEELIWSRA